MKSSEIQHIGSKSYIKSKVVTIESKSPNKKDDICKFSYGLNIAAIDDIGYPAINLYFLSNEEIKEPSWCLDEDRVWFCDKSSPYFGDILPKIIASTDKKLWSKTPIPEAGGYSQATRDIVAKILALK